jgi:putative ribosome biogenesis GTPase RsgA
LLHWEATELAFSQSRRARELRRCGEVGICKEFLASQRAFATMDKENAPKYSAVYKLTLVGESGTGKSSMLSRFADDKCLTSHIATIGVDFKVAQTYPPMPPTHT